MAASAASSLLPSQLLRYLSSRLGALYRSAPSASLQQPRPPFAVAHSEEVEAVRGDKMAAAPTSVPRGVDVAAAAAGQLMVARRGGAPPKGRPGLPREGGGGKTNAVPTLARVAKRGRRTPTPLGPPAEGAGGRGGKIHAAAASASS